jgi:sugar (pentulose or hexulose) kinase
VLALDVGTQSVRALVFDGDGYLLAKSRVPLVDYRSPRSGWHEHDANGFWKALCSACQGLWQAHAALQQRVVGVGFTTQLGQAAVERKEA